MIAVVIPSYRVRKTILKVIEDIGPEVQKIFVIDDACPERSGEFVRTHCRDHRVTIIEHLRNQGVGGAVMTGYKAAIQEEASVIVKVDGDGQMNPRLISHFVKPIIEGRADYTKGNRFYQLESLKGMPWARLVGNAGLSFCSKLSSGYWKVMDPTNGFTAIHGSIAALLPFEKIAKRYFFESDMLFRLSTVQAKIVDVPMDAQYADEKSSLSISKTALQFPFLHASRLGKRIFYNYFLRDFTVASLELVFGSILFLFGISFGLYHWAYAFSTGTETPTGTIFLAALNVILGFQLLLSWLTFDVNSQPREALHTALLPLALVRNEALNKDLIATIERRVGE